MGEKNIKPGNAGAGGSEQNQPLLGNLQALAYEAGVEIPSLANFQPSVDLDRTDTEIARDLGSYCSRHPIFRQGENIIALNSEGRLRAMSPRRLGGWVESFISTSRFTRDRGRHAASIPEALAARLLEHDQFLVKLRPLIHSFPVRLPVLRPCGKVDLLPAGYDEQTRSWTTDGLKYSKNWDLDRAKDWFSKVLGEWPWADLVGSSNKCPSKSRNAAVVLTGMLGIYCRAFLNVSDKRPLIALSGSQAGTGKSTLARLISCAVYGLPPESDLPSQDDKFARLLESMGLSFAPVLFLDDIGKHLKSNALNRFITASVHSGVKLYSQTPFEVPNVTQVIATGNDLSLENDLARRAMLCELFLPGEVQGRKFQFEVSDALLATPEFRAEALAAMWAIVREWGEGRAAGVLEERKTLASFEVYSRLICSLTQVLGWRDPLDAPEGISGGDLDTRAAKTLLLALADAQGHEMVDYVVNDLVAKARDLGLLERMVGIESDGPLKKGERVRLGKFLGRFTGVPFQRTDGNYFQFGRRDGSSGSIYPCRLSAKLEDLL